ncbi:MAG: hypothetical protein INF18_08545 [Methylobacterium sp.]|nr:hypothetical protein [Methylobacterium sp.]
MRSNYRSRPTKKCKEVALAKRDQRGMRLTLNLARGFWRIWVASTCLWIVVAAVIVWSDLFPGQKKWTVEIADIGIVEICTRSNVSSTELADWIKINMDVIRQNPKEKCINQGSMPSLQVFANASMFIFFPPIFILSLEFLVRWIVQGFIRN